MSFCESPYILDLYSVFGLSIQKATFVFGFENPFLNFSPEKTHPIQLSFDAGINTTSVLCINGNFTLFVMFISFLQLYRVGDLCMRWSKSNLEFLICVHSNVSSDLNNNNNKTRAVLFWEPKTWVEILHFSLVSISSISDESRHRTLVRVCVSVNTLTWHQIDAFYSGSPTNK